MKKYIAILASSLLVLSACQKQFEDVPMTSSLTGSAAAALVEQDPAFLSSYVSGFYSYMVQFNTAGNKGHDDFGYLSLGMIGDIMCQDIAVNGSWNWGTYDINHDYGAENWVRCYQYWNFFYTLIAKANEVIDFFGKEDPTNATLKGYLGQAYALRALCYTNLMVYFQDVAEGNWPNATFNKAAKGVPLVFATRDERTPEEVDQNSGRNTLEIVCAHIEENIAKALPLLEGYNRASKNEINSNVAYGIAARYYLLTQQWSQAADAANKARQGFILMDEARQKSGFMELEDPEVMWGFNHSTETQTAYASFFSHMSNECSGYGGVGQSVRCIDKSLYDKIGSTDIRKSLYNTAAGDSKAATTGAQFPYAARKFGFVANWLQDYTFMRAAEMYLIEAEALLMGGSEGQAKTVLGELMDTRDLGWVCNTLTREEVYLQRRIELWGEGFNYFDVRRLAIDVDRKYDGSNHLASAQKAYNAHDISWNFQIPLKEMQNNNHIAKDEQNEWETGER